MPFYVFGFSQAFWPFGPWLCSTLLKAAMIFAFEDWSLLALIAISRCLSLTRKNWWEEFCGRRNVFLMLAGTWAFVFVINIPQYLDESVAFGYSCKIGKCGLFETGKPVSKTFKIVVKVVYASSFAIKVAGLTLTTN